MSFPSTDRRRFLRNASMMAGLASVPRFGLPQATPAPQNPGGTGIPGTVAVPVNLPTLREAAASRGLLVGSAVASAPLRSNPAYAELLKQQANIVVAENAMKFGPLRPAPDKFAFEDADALFAFAEANGIKVRGHNFVWHRQLPAWFSGYVTKQNAASVLTNHIETVGARYAGRVHSWDVVNEAIHLDDKLPGGLRDSPWQRLLGSDYLDLAFRTARRVDPKALLCYNDYGIEDEGPGDSAKRAALLNLLRGMQQRGVPVDAVGIQSHLNAGKAQYGPGLQSFLHEIRGMGFKILLTEMDVNDRALPADIASRDRAVADVYRHYLDLTLGSTDVVAALTWGLTDKYTWLNGEGSRPDQQPERALPFDADLRPKLAYIAEVEAIQHAPSRS